MYVKAVTTLDFSTLIFTQKHQTSFSIFLTPLPGMMTSLKVLEVWCFWRGGEREISFPFNRSLVTREPSVGLGGFCWYWTHSILSGDDAGGTSVTLAHENQHIAFLILTVPETCLAILS